MRPLLNLINLALLCLLPYISWAQANLSAKSRQLSLQECVDLAIKNNITVRTTELNVLQSRVALEQSKADLLPSLNANSNFQYNVGRTINPFTNEYVSQPIRQQNLSISADLLLFNGFRKLKTIKQNKLNLLSNEYGLEAQKNDVILNVVEAYVQILLNQELLRNAQFTAQSTQSQLERTRRLVEAGSLPIGNVLQLESQQATDELNIITATNNLALAQLQLEQLLLIPENESFSIVEPTFDLPDSTELPSSAYQVYQQSVAKLPQIKQVQAEVDAAQYGISIAKAGFYPRLNLSGGLFSQYSSVAPDQIPASGSDNIPTVLPTGDFLVVPNNVPGLTPGDRLPVFTEQNLPKDFTDNTYLNQLDFNYQRFLQLSLNIPIFNNWRVRSDVANARISLENAQLNELNQQNVLRQTIEQVYLNVRANAQQYQAAERRVTQFQRAFQDTERRYQAQAIDVYAYNQAQNDLTAAEADALQARYNYLLSLKVLDFYLGKPLTF
ncbi:MAG: TolC family protein [Bacteroidota bacterium]